MPQLNRIVLLFAALLFSGNLMVEARVVAIPVPSEIRSTEFSVQVNGKPVDTVHAAASYDYVSIDSSGPVTISVTASEAGFWDHGVDLQPWRLGIRPLRKGNTIEFRLKDPAKLSISRPGDFLNHAKMLFVFVSKPVPSPPRADSTESASSYDRARDSQRQPQP